MSVDISSVLLSRASHLSIDQVVVMFVFRSFVCLDIGDGQLEVVGLENTLFVSQIIVGVRAHGLRLAQCSSIVIRLVYCS